MIQKIKTKKGFTIIEVVLVLAIAGLIFLMVFVVFPQLQRNQRDTQRRDDMSRFLTAVMNYQTNNRNRLPFYDSTGTVEGDGSGETTNTYKLINDYLKVAGDTFEDPSTGKTYEIYSLECEKQNNGDCELHVYQTGSGQNATNVTDLLGKITVYTNAKCDGEKPVYVQGNRKFAFTLKLEGAGTYCGQN